MKFSLAFIFSFGFSFAFQPSLLLAAVVPVQTQPPQIRFLSISAPTSEPLETLLDSSSNAEVHVKESARNVKLSIVFDRPLALRFVQIDSCAKSDWSDGIDVFTSPGAGHVFTEGGRKKLRAKFKTTGEVESIAIVFGRNTALCLKSLKFFGEDEAALPFSLNRAVSIKTSGSPQTGRLFDSRPETQIALEDPLQVTFATSVAFDRAIIWTGGTSLHAHSLKLKDGKGWSETLPLRNAVTEQEVVFKKPFSGKEMTILAPDAGEVSEVRFANRTNVQALKVEVAEVSLTDDHAKKFAAAGFESLLDSKWITGDDEKWTFLFRGDGTFFIRGRNDDSNQARDYSALGSYTIVRQEKGKLRLRINGVRLPTGDEWDGVSCPLLCGSEVALETSTSVVDSLVLEQQGEGTLMIRNRTPRLQRTLTFGDLKIRRAVDD